jgi:hypothetical protein
MAMTKLTSDRVSVGGMIAVYIIPALTKPPAVVVADLTATGVVSAACAIHGGISGGDMNISTTDSQPLCSAVAVTELDNVSYNNLEIVVSQSNPQGPDPLAALPQGTKLWVAARKGLPSDDAPAATQKLIVWHGEFVYDSWTPISDASGKFEGKITLLVDSRAEVAVTAS